MSNLIQIKRSESTAIPTSLANGELAWSGNSEILWIGDFGGVYAVGGPGQIEVTSELSKEVAANGVVTIGLQANVNFTDIDLDTLTLGDYTVLDIIDDDTMAAASNTTLSTSESIKAYVDSEISNVVAGSATELSDLNDVAALTPEEGDFLIYDGTQQEWVSGTLAAGVGLSGAYANATDTFTIDLDDTAVTSGSYGNATHVSTFTVDAQGRLTAASNTAIAIPASALTTDVALGTDTSGNYVASITASNTITSSAANTGETTNHILSVVAGNGLFSDVTGLNVGFGDGITGNATHVAIDVSGNTLTVDASGLSVNEGALSIATSQLTGSVALGTQTSGDYVANVAQGSGISITNAGGEGSTPTIAAVGANGITITTAGINVDAEGGLFANTTGLYVGQGNGITVNTDDVAVNAQDGLLANSTGLFVKTGNGITIDGSGNVAISSGDNVTFGDLTVEGDLTVTGNVVSLQITEFDVEDPLIHLASNNVADSLDIGFVGRYSDDAGSTIEHAGLFRDADDEKFHFFKNLVDANLDNGATTINKGDATYAKADVVMANLEAVAISATSLTLTTDLAVTHGGTGVSSFTDNGILYGDGTNALDVTAAGTEGQVLQAGPGGVPQFGSLDGGTF